MNDFGAQLLLSFVAWLFWLVVSYLFIALMQRRLKRSYSGRERLIFASILALVLTSMNLAVSLVMKLK